MPVQRLQAAIAGFAQRQKKTAWSVYFRCRTRYRLPSGARRKVNSSSAASTFPAGNGSSKARIRHQTGTFLIITAGCPRTLQRIELSGTLRRMRISAVPPRRR